MLAFNESFRTLLNESIENIAKSDIKDMLMLDESTKVQVSDVLLKRLLQSSAGKVKDVDFGDIPDSAGDITKVKDYQRLKDSLDVVEGIASESGKQLNEVTIIRTAMKNIEDRKKEFESAFVMEDQLLTMLYVSNVMAIYYATSHLITVTIEYVRDPNLETLEPVLTNLDYNKDRMLAIKNLERFNKAVDKGDLDKFIKHTLETRSKNLTGSTVFLVAVAIVPLTALFIYSIRELIYLFYFSRIKFADFCTLQIEFLEAQAEFNKSRTSKGKDYKKVAKRQLRTVKRLEKVRNFIEVQNNRAVKETTNAVKKDKPVEDLVDLDKDLTSIKSNNNIII